MAIRISIARGALACFLTVAAGSMLAPAAHAQHVVTDFEAGKLTLDALTATPRPIFHRVVYRTLRPSWTASSRFHTMRAVHETAYRRSLHEATYSRVASRRRRG